MAFVQHRRLINRPPKLEPAAANWTQQIVPAILCVATFALVCFGIKTLLESGAAGPAALLPASSSTATAAVDVAAGKAGELEH
jgi:hypothetical protein